MKINYKMVTIHYSKNGNGSMSASVYTRKDGKLIIANGNEWEVKAEVEKRGLRIVESIYH